MGLPYHLLASRFPTPFNFEIDLFCKMRKLLLPISTYYDYVLNPRIITLTKSGNFTMPAWVTIRQLGYIALVVLRHSGS